jgi:hypothetical protein
LTGYLTFYMLWTVTRARKRIVAKTERGVTVSLNLVAQEEVRMARHPLLQIIVDLVVVVGLELGPLAALILLPG